jgi:hypothetical protein
MKKLLMMGIAVLVILCMVPGMVAAVPPSITVTVNVKASDGTTGIVGAKVFYKLGSTYNFGTTGSSGSVSKAFPAGTTNLEVWVVYQGTTSVHTTQDISTAPVFSFQTRRLTHRLENSAMEGLNGGKIRYGIGSTYTTWWFPGGPTGSTVDGETEAQFFPGRYSFEMQYKGSTSRWLDLDLGDSDTIVIWKTEPVTLRLEDCDGHPLDGGMVRYGPGSTYTTWWWPGGATGSGSNPDGETTAELLCGGTYSFEMQYQGTAQQQLSQVIRGVGPVFTWRTTRVMLDYPGMISYGGPTGQSRWFTRPAMELLSGAPYRFHFQHPEGGRLWLSWSGCEYYGCVRMVDMVQKTRTGDVWIPVPGGASGRVTLVRNGGPFEMTGKGLTPGNQYSLIYYPDPWNGVGLKEIGTGTALPGGTILMTGTFDFQNIPYPAPPASLPTDDNAPEAKIWLVLSSDIQYSNDADPSNDYFLSWNPDSYLFEVNLLDPLSSCYPA